MSELHPDYHELRAAAESLADGLPEGSVDHLKHTGTFARHVLQWAGHMSRAGFHRANSAARREVPSQEAVEASAHASHSWGKVRDTLEPALPGILLVIGGIAFVLEHSRHERAEHTSSDASSGSADEPPADIVDTDISHEQA